MKSRHVIYNYYFTRCNFFFFPFCIYFFIFFFINFLLFLFPFYFVLSKNHTDGGLRRLSLPFLTIPVKWVVYPKNNLPNYLPLTSSCNHDTRYQLMFVSCILTMTELNLLKLKFVFLKKGFCEIPCSSSQISSYNVWHILEKNGVAF